MAQSFWMD